MKYIFGNTELEFSSESGGTPSRITCGGSTVLGAALPLFSAKLADGRTVRPFNPGNAEPLQSETDEVLRLTFQNLKWKDEDGAILADFHMSITYEIWNDGAIFADTFFMVESVTPPELVDFQLTAPLSLGDPNRLRWGFIDRPAASDFAMIQSSAPERFLKPGDDRKFVEKIVPLFSFDGVDDTGFHYEFFVEGHDTLTADPAHARTEVNWTRDSAEIAWNFQTEPASDGKRPWQWRNRWGMLLTKAPTKRNLPPLRMYHYFDNFERYPEEELIAGIADSGADVLILHENWRQDAQNGGIPYDAAELRRVVESAHARGLRIALYIRGNEDSAYSGSCAWFDELLDKNRDGLYMDYGGPIHMVEPPTENFPGGRMLFRTHHQNIRALRRRVGDNGVLFSHTGPCFSALGMTNGGLDGYVSGEGERGVMVKSRRIHEYFSAAYAANGSMWTAAFPEYGSPKMVPYLAATGQFPHNPLGVQFETSSLAHPRHPGVNDVYLRPLWRIWGLFKDERGISVFNDYNSVGVFSDETDDAGSYLMVSENGRNALLIASNFNENESETALSVEWRKAGVDVSEFKKCFQFRPLPSSPGEPLECPPDKTRFEATIEGYGVAAWLLTADPERFSARIADFAKPYPAETAANRAYLDEIEEQRRLREKPPVADARFLKVEIGNIAAPYEESMWWDLFDNAFQLGVLAADGEFNALGWISTDGFVEAEPAKTAYVLPGQQSPWIDLGSVIPKQKCEVGIRSIHFGEPFYSFIKATLATSPDDEAESYEIKFFNEIENDRSFLRFNLEFLK